MENGKKKKGELKIKNAGKQRGVSVSSKFKNESGKRRVGNMGTRRGASASRILPPMALDENKGRTAMAK